MELSGKLAIVTGASRGIGRALAKELAKQGCGLLLTALEENELSAVSQEIRRKGLVPVEAMAVDLSAARDRKRLIDWILSRKNPPDILINNAGIGYFGRLEGADPTGIERTICINVSALVHLTHDLIPILKTRPRSKIVNVSSASSRLPYPGLAIYGATKAFVSSFSQSLAAELDGTSIDVLCFHPGFTLTPFMESAGMDMSRVKKILIHSPEKVAVEIVRAIRKDKHWGYPDLLTRLSVLIGAVLPVRLKIALFERLCWRLSDVR
jgi:short-subunit dehydrogenase